MARHLGGRWVWPVQSKYGHADLPKLQKRGFVGVFRKCGSSGSKLLSEQHVKSRSWAWNLPGGFYAKSSAQQVLLHYWGQHRRKDWKRTLWKLNLKKPNSCFCGILKTFELFKFRESLFALFLWSNSTMARIGKKCTSRLLNYRRFLSISLSAF